MALWSTCRNVKAIDVYLHCQNTKRWHLHVRIQATMSLNSRSGFAHCSIAYMQKFFHFFFFSCGHIKSNLHLLQLQSQAFCHRTVISTTSCSIFSKVKLKDWVLKYCYVVRINKWMILLHCFAPLPLSYMCQAVCIWWDFPPLGTPACPASSSDLIKSQSQRQLGQSNKLRCNAVLMPGPAAVSVWLRCHGSVQPRKQNILKQRHSKLIN